FGAGESRIMGIWVPNANLGNPVATRFILAPGNTNQLTPSAVGGSGAYLVAYVSGNPGTQDIKAVWVSGTTGLPGPEFTIAATANNEDNVHVAVDTVTTPPTYAVIWQDNSLVGPIKAVLLKENMTAP